MPSGCVIESPTGDECCPTLICNDNDSPSSNGATSSSDNGDDSSPTETLPITYNGSSQVTQVAETYPTSSPTSLISSTGVPNTLKPSFSDYRSIPFHTIPFQKDSVASLLKSSAFMSLNKRDRLLALLISRHGPFSFFSSSKHHGKANQEIVTPLIDPKQVDFKENHMMPNDKLVQPQSDILRSVVGTAITAKTHEPMLSGKYSIQTRSLQTLLKVYNWSMT